MRVMHRVAVEFPSMLCRMLAAPGHRAVVSVSVVEMMIDVSVKVFRSVEPWTRADENTAGEPLGSVKTVRRAVIGRSL